MLRFAQQSDRTCRYSSPRHVLPVTRLLPANALLRVRAASFDCVPNDNKWAIMGGEGGSKSSTFNDRKKSRRPKVTPMTASLSLTALLAHKNAQNLFFFLPLFKFLLLFLMLVTTLTFKLSILMIDRLLRCWIHVFPDSSHLPRWLFFTGPIFISRDVSCVFI